MNYRKAVSFNLADSKYKKTKSGRVSIQLGVQERTMRVLAAIAQSGKKGLTITDIISYASSQKWKYSREDIRTSLNKLKSERLIRAISPDMFGANLWLATKGAIAAFNKLPVTYC